MKKRESEGSTAYGYYSPGGGAFLFSAVQFATRKQVKVEFVINTNGTVWGDRK